MTPKEFEDLTGIYPDRVQYDVIEREYERHARGRRYAAIG